MFLFFYYNFLSNHFERERERGKVLSIFWVHHVRTGEARKQFAAGGVLGSSLSVALSLLLQTVFGLNSTHAHL